MSSPTRQFRRALSIDIHDPYEESFIANGDVFIKDNVAINSTGIAMRDNPKTFQLIYDELEIGQMIGRGSCSVVLHGIHSTTNTPLALKIINLFDKVFQFLSCHTYINMYTQYDLWLA